MMHDREAPDDLIRHDRPLPGSAPAFSAVPLHKYQALGNDYLVVSEEHLIAPPTPEQFRLICHPHYGVDADGIALDVSTGEQFAVRIFNPDGSEAEIRGTACASSHATCSTWGTSTPLSSPSGRKAGW